jgi:hypothetical protein
MPLPIPEPGLVLCYEFLWSSEHQAGHEQGEKKRPSVVVLKTKTDAGQISVTVAPITHSPPRAHTHAIEIPLKVKQHLGLDSQRSWIVYDELNEFIWPGFDLYPVPGGRLGQFDYGFLPPALFDRVIKSILQLDARMKRIIPR